MGSSGPQTILVIDDDVSVQTFVAKTLNKEGYQVLVASDMQEALQVSDACATEIHFIVTDIMLPISNGMALAQILLAERPNTLVLTCQARGRMRFMRFNSRVRRLGSFSRRPSRRRNW